MPRQEKPRNDVSELLTSYLDNDCNVHYVVNFKSGREVHLAKAEVPRDMRKEFKMVNASPEKIHNIDKIVSYSPTSKQVGVVWEEGKQHGRIPLDNLLDSRKTEKAAKGLDTPSRNLLVSDVKALQKTRAVAPQEALFQQKQNI